MYNQIGEAIVNLTKSVTQYFMQWIHWRKIQKLRKNKLTDIEFISGPPRYCEFDELPSWPNQIYIEPPFESSKAPGHFERIIFAFWRIFNELKMRRGDYISIR